MPLSGYCYSVIPENTKVLTETVIEIKCEILQPIIEVKAEVICND